ncbi:heavy-metal-associated domain-containing protein [Halospeciosus flavus]|uniref:Heavy-metal-associated domain-containing protein n=1 Tax=Halospeciosus flavus TaxID=3032283 RepID=A0ABD5Z5T4_9EURY|nr:heavy-metal-associated domain-containing protein [Halospeciosus flavus]
MSKTFDVDGMTCSGCEKIVSSEVGDIDDAESIEADHEAGTVTVTGDVDEDDVADAVEDVGYELQGSHDGADGQTFEVENVDSPDAADTVAEAVGNLDEVDSASADHEDGTVTVTGDVDEDDVEDAVEDVGYDLD